MFESWDAVSISENCSGGCYIMRVWPSNRLEPEYRIPLQEQFVKAVAIFKVLIALYLDTFICCKFDALYSHRDCRYSSRVCFVIKSALSAIFSILCPLLFSARIQFRGMFILKCCKVSLVRDNYNPFWVCGDEISVNSICRFNFSIISILVSLPAILLQSGPCRNTFLP